MRSFSRHPCYMGLFSWSAPCFGPYAHLEKKYDRSSAGGLHSSLATVGDRLMMWSPLAGRHVCSSNCATHAADKNFESKRTSQSNHMKTTVLFSILALGSAINADHVIPSKHHETLLLWSQYQYVTDSSGMHYNGAVIYVSSSSCGAPTFPQQNITHPVELVQTADAITQAKNLGFHVTKISDSGDFIAMEK